jgi:hypothetical protein
MEATLGDMAFGRSNDPRASSPPLPTPVRTIRAPPRPPDRRRARIRRRRPEDASGTALGEDVDEAEGEARHRANPRRARGGRAILETSEDPDASKVAAHLRTCRDAGDFDDLVGRRARWRVYFGG